MLDDAADEVVSEGEEAVAFVEALKRALAAAGSFASGVPDLAERHDDYLTQA